MRINEVARMIGFHPDTIRNLEKAGALSFQRDRNGHRRFTLEDVERVRQAMFQRTGAEPQNVGLVDVAS